MKIALAAVTLAPGPCAAEMTAAQFAYGLATGNTPEFQSILEHVILLTPVSLLSRDSRT